MVPYFWSRCKRAWSEFSSITSRGRIFSQAGNELETSFLMIFPYTQCLAGNGLIPKLTKIKDFAILLLIEQKYFVVDDISTIKTLNEDDLKLRMKFYI
jgi:hypothetical protein